MELSSIIQKLILAGTVELVGREPVFTKKFMAHIAQMLQTTPSLDESAEGWNRIVVTFDKSLGELSDYELRITISILVYHLAISDADMEMQASLT